VSPPQLRALSLSPYTLQWETEPKSKFTVWFPHRHSPPPPLRSTIRGYWGHFANTPEARPQSPPTATSTNQTVPEARGGKILLVASRFWSAAQKPTGTQTQEGACVLEGKGGVPPLFASTECGPSSSHLSWPRVLGLARNFPVSAKVWVLHSLKASVFVWVIRTGLISPLAPNLEFEA